MMQKGLASLKGYRAHLKDSWSGSASPEEEEVETLDLLVVSNHELKETERR